MPLNSSEIAVLSPPLEINLQQPHLCLPMTPGMPARNWVCSAPHGTPSWYCINSHSHTQNSGTQNFWCAHSDCNHIVSAKFSVCIQCNLTFLQRFPLLKDEKLPHKLRTRFSPFWHNAVCSSEVLLDFPSHMWPEKKELGSFPILVCIKKHGTAWPHIHSPELKSSSQEAIRFKEFRDSAGWRQWAKGQKEHLCSEKALE